MSIINEALKKTGQPIIAEAQKTAQETKSGFRPELLRKKSRMNWGPVFMIGVLTLITMPILTPLFYNPYKTTPIREVSIGSALAIPNSRMSGQFAIEEMPIAMTHRSAAIPPVELLPNFSLNGLVYSKTDSYCLINGKVMRVGDRVGGATLSQVTPNKAVLDYHGEKVVLPANAA